VLHEWFAFPIAGAEAHVPLSARLRSAPGAGGAPPGPEVLLGPRAPRIVRAGCRFRALCAPGAGKLLSWAIFGGPGASAPLGGRQGTLGPVLVHSGRDLRAEAAPMFSYPGYHLLPTCVSPASALPRVARALCRALSF